MNNLFNEIEQKVDVEKQYLKLQSNKDSIQSKLNDLNNLIKEAKKTLSEIKNFKKFSSLLDNKISLDEIDSSENISDLKESYQNKIDNFLENESLSEINSILINIRNKIENIEKERIKQFEKAIKNFEDQFEKIKKLSTIPDLQKQYDNIGKNIFINSKRSGIIEYLKKQFDTLNNINTTNRAKSIKIIKNLSNLINNLKSFFEETQNIADVEKIAKSYDLSGNTQVLLMDIISQGYSPLNNINKVVLEELSNNFKKLKNNLIIKLKE